MNINGFAPYNQQVLSCRKNNNRSNVSFGDLREIELNGDFDYAKKRPEKRPDLLASIKAFMDAEWKDTLGEKYDYKAVFASSGSGCRLALLPYSDEKSKLPPIPEYIEYRSSSPAKLTNMIKNESIDIINSKIKDAFLDMEERNILKAQQNKILERLEKEGIELDSCFKNPMLYYSMTLSPIEAYRNAEWKNGLKEKYSFTPVFTRSMSDGSYGLRLEPRDDKEGKLPPLPTTLSCSASSPGALTKKINKVSLEKVNLILDKAIKRQEEQRRQEQEKQAILDYVAKYSGDKEE